MSVDQSFKAAISAAQNARAGGWSDERVAILRKCIDRGLSANETAMTLRGVTRNAVIGKAARLGLSFGLSEASSPRSKAGAGLTPRANAGTRANKKAVFNTEPHTPGIVRAPKRFAPDAPSATPVQLVDLMAHHCRWPIGDTDSPSFHFCGARKVDGGSYCGSHALRSTVPTASASLLARSLRRYA